MRRTCLASRQAWRRSKTQFDEKWGTGPVRSRLRAPSLELLVRYLQKPDPEAWQRAVFTELLALFDPSDMTSAERRGEFDAAASRLPSELRDTLVGLPDETAFAGRGSWRGRVNPQPAFAELFLALPLEAVKTQDPDALVAGLHLDDAGQAQDAAYRREWNGVLRLFNLLQFLPGAWWSTANGVKRDVYPDYGLPLDAHAEDLGEWAEAVDLAASALQSAMREFAGQGLPAPQVGFELTDADGRVVAEAELAWEAERLAVIWEAQDGARFDHAGWQTFAADDPALCNRVGEAFEERGP